MSKQEKLVAALKLWEVITGFEGDRNSYTIGQWRIADMSKSIREALELDDTNITGFLILSYFANKFIGDKGFPLNDLLNKPEEVAQYVANSRELLELLNDKGMVEDLEHFQLTTRQAVRHYGADTEEVMNLIASRHDIGLLRRDALSSMKKLRVDHFTEGEPEGASVRPVYNREVHQFWNINSMLRSLCNSPSGVSLNLIRTPDGFQSYFVFAIRNGGHIITLSDVPENCHPLQAYMSRRPDKEYGNRIIQNWFPYDLMNYKYDEEYNRIWIEAQDFGNVVTPINQTAFPLSAIKELGACEIIWITLMFELIVDRFWRQPVSAPKLSYTGEMVKVESALIDHAASINLPVVQYQGIEAQPLTLEEVAYPSESNLAALGKSGGDHNQWMIDRYQHRVNPLMLNMLNTGDVVAYLNQGESDGTLPDVVSAKKYERDVDTIFNRVKRYKYHSLDTASFGSKEQLLNDRVFLARANLATEIQRLADIEYKARKEEVMTWYRERIEANADFIYSLAITDQAWIQIESSKAPYRVMGRSRRAEGVIRYQVAEVYTREQQRKDCLHLHADFTLSCGIHSGYNWACHETGAKASWMIHVTPHTAADLAMLAGVEVSELPDVLQHWMSKQDHKGNHLLSRIDPVAWKLHNPWIDHLNFRVNLWLSTRSFNRIRKTMTLPESPKIYVDSKEDWNFKEVDPFDGM